MLTCCATGSIAAAKPNRAQAYAVVDVNLASNAVVVRGPHQSDAATPGSTLKPMVLLAALRLGVVTPGTRIACRRVLHVAGRNLTCAHPASISVPDAEAALAYSCNSYFAQVAQQLPDSAMQTALARFGVHGVTTNGTPEERVLLTLGLDEHVRITPMQLARAYVQLARELPRSGAEGGTVEAGLLDSVRFGMAHAAQTAGMILGGKTGTAHDPAPRLQHGWFAGIIFSATTPSQPMRVIVVYAPGGSGNDAALAAHRYLESGRP